MWAVRAEWAAFSFWFLSVDRSGLGRALLERVGGRDGLCEMLDHCLLLRTCTQAASARPTVRFRIPRIVPAIYISTHVNCPVVASPAASFPRSANADAGRRWRWWHKGSTTWHATNKHMRERTRIPRQTSAAQNEYARKQASARSPEYCEYPCC
jgi:hypothetical protein